MEFRGGKISPCMVFCVGRCSKGILSKDKFKMTKVQAMQIIRQTYEINH